MKYLRLKKMLNMFVFVFLLLPVANVFGQLDPFSMVAGEIVSKFFQDRIEEFIQIENIKGLDTISGITYFNNARQAGDEKINSYYKNKIEEVNIKMIELVNSKRNDTQSKKALANYLNEISRLENLNSRDMQKWYNYINESINYYKPYWEKTKVITY